MVTTTTTAAAATVAKTGTKGSKPGAVIATCAFYPSCDYTTTREERGKTNLRPDKELPRFFTDLFDMLYLAPQAVSICIIFTSHPDLRPTTYCILT